MLPTVRMSLLLCTNCCMQEVLSYKGTYQCTGWSKDHPPKLICSLTDLSAAHDQFDTSKGERVEAVLSRYSMINDYNICRGEYYAKIGKPDPSEDKYGMVISVNGSSCEACISSCTHLAGSSLKVIRLREMDPERGQ